MINVNGIIQNNRTASEFIRNQKKFNSVYPVLSKKQEREMIERYARLKYDENGKLIYRTTPSEQGKNDDFECEFEWIGDEAELRNLLIMHNLQAVTNMTTKHCQDTRDYDNMFGNGLFGLSKAANLFHPFKLVTKVVGYTTDETGKKVPIKDVKLDENGNYSFVKFITCAQSWIFKYVVGEFYTKSIKIDNNSTSLDELVKIGNNTNKNLTMENYISDMISPEVEPVKTIEDNINNEELSDLFSQMADFVETSSDISSLEKGVFQETYINGVTNKRKLASIFGVSMAEIEENQISVLNKLKIYLHDDFGIDNLSDVF